MTTVVVHDSEVTAERLHAVKTRQHAMWARFGEISIRTAPRRRQAGVVSVALDSMLLG